MKKEDKVLLVEKIAAAIKDNGHFYLADLTAMDAEKTSALRAECFKRNIKLMVVKNTMVQKALDSLDADYSTIYGCLKGNTALMLSEVGNAPAKLIKEFGKGQTVPAFKGAYVEECFYLDGSLEALTNLKSKTELIGDVIGLLQSPAKNVISALQSGGQTIHGVLKTLAEK